MPLKIIRNDIINMQVDAIVNTANCEPQVGPGCDYAIYTAAGYDELLSYRREFIGHVDEGRAFITPAFNLPCRSIIHAVSPLFIDGMHGEEAKLRSCYRESLALAQLNGFRTVAIPLIGTGSFGYSLEEGFQIAVDEITEFLDNHSDPDEMTVYIVVFNRTATKLSGKFSREALVEYIDDNYVDRKTAAYTMESGRSGSIFGRFGSRILGRRESVRPRLDDASVFENAPPLSALPEFNAEPTVDAMPALDAAPAFKNAPDFGNESLQEEAEAKLEPSMYLELDDSPSFDDYLESMEAPQFSEISIDDYEDISDYYKARIEERSKHLSDTFTEYLVYLIESRGMTYPDVYTRACIDKRTFSKIKNNRDAHPKKVTILSLCVGAKLNIDQAKDLLARAGYALSPCDMTDVIFSYFIENEIYDMVELDLQLEAFGLPCLIQ